MDPMTLAAGTLPFEDARVPEMVFRYRARNFPESLSADEQSRWQAYRRDQFETDGRLKHVIAETEQRLQETPSEALDELLGYLKAQEPSL